MHENTNEEPPWRVLIHNNSDTSWKVTDFDFVIRLVKEVFNKPEAEAEELVEKIHKTGKVTAIFANMERAELYVEQVTAFTRGSGFALTATAEPR